MDDQRDQSKKRLVVAIVGVGLIGGSFAAALRQADKVNTILGVGRTGHRLSKALQLGLIDRAVTLEEAAQLADLIFLSTPVGSVLPLLERLAPLLQPHTIVTDAGSTKLDIAQQAGGVLQNKSGQFVPGHPIAGSEVTGPEGAQAELFQHRTVVLTPTRDTRASALERVTQIWQWCGARVLSMDAARHDKILASVSHVPHFLSAVFMWQVAQAEDADLRLALAGSGFRDFTRIAAGSSEVWRDIFLANRQAILSELQQVKQALNTAEQALQAGEGEALQDFLEHAALARRFWGSRSGLS